MDVDHLVTKPQLCNISNETDVNLVMRRKIMKTKIFVLALLAVLIFTFCVSLRTKYSKQVAIVEKIISDETYLIKIRNDSNYVNIKSYFFTDNDLEDDNRLIQVWFKEYYQITDIEETTHYLNAEKIADGIRIIVERKDNAKGFFHFYKYGDKYLLEHIKLGEYHW